MIDVVDLTVHYSVEPVLKNINLHINGGEPVVIVGPDGMGKTTLLAAMAGVVPPHRGLVKIDGRIRRGSVAEEIEIRRTAVYLPDQPWLPVQTTAEEYLMAVGRLYDVPNDRLYDQIKRLFKIFEMDGQRYSPIRSCSAGQKKKVALSAALLTESPVLLLDEPFSGGLDPAGVLALKRVLKRRTAEEGSTVVMTSPVPEIVEEIADRVLILRSGEVAAFDTIDGLRRLTGIQGSLGEVLERLRYPEMAAQLDDFFARRTEA